MELEPTTECGTHLYKLLRSWIAESPDVAQTALHRVFILYSSKIENQDAFLDTLYGQGTLQREHWELNKEDPSPEARLSRLRHAIEASTANTDTLHVKELVVALEWSENETMLTNILEWAEEKAGSKEITEVTRTLSYVDLAPERAPKKFASMLSSSSSRPATPRQREINYLKGESVSAVAVCRNCHKIILGFQDGPINIYNSVDLECKLVFPYYDQPSSVYCVQCTCTEIIAGYADGYVCAWDIKSGILKQKISVRGPGGKDRPFRMQWRDPKLVLTTSEKRIQIWQYVNSAFTILGGWSTTGLTTTVRRIDFDDTYVVLQDYPSHSVHVYLPNGKLVRRIDSEKNTMITGMAYQNGKLFTGGRDHILRIWDVRTGDCLHELKEVHSSEIMSVQVDVHEDYGTVLSGDNSGTVVVWDLAKIMATSPGKRKDVNTCLTAEHSARKLVIDRNIRGNGYEGFIFGPNFVLAITLAPTFHVADFS